MDGLLIVDKPSGPTSHDIVALARRVLRERRIGHTGTLDPMATGVLPLVVGRATRLARFLGGDKTYDAVIRLGAATDTYDALGTAQPPAFDGPWPAAAAVEAVLDRFRGPFLQEPPAYSAKKIDGERSYAIARRRAHVEAAAGGSDDATAADAVRARPVEVTVHHLELRQAEGDQITLRVRCSAGFYVRSLAHDLGRALGTGGHLAALRRIEAAGVGLDGALPLARMSAPGGLEAATAALVPLDQMLPLLAAVSLTAEGVARVQVGQDVGPDQAVGGFRDALAAAARQSFVRLTDGSGRLVAVGEASASPGLLHPSVVLV